MPPKTKQAKRNEKTPVKDSTKGEVTDTPRSPTVIKGDGVPIDGDAAVAQPVPAAYERPKMSKGPMYFFAASFLFRAIIAPYYTTLNVTGLVNRWSYPSGYTAPGVSCAVEALDGPEFCEHEVLFKEQGVALLSCDPGRGEWNTVMGPLKNPDPKGKLWLYDYGGTKESKELSLGNFPVDSDFHPLGINYFSDNVKTSLFVINHQRTGPSIEIFSLDPKKGLKMALKHKRTIPASEEIKSANGIVAINHDQLYVTNDHAWTRLEAGGPWAITETFLGPVYPESWITHIDLSAASTTTTEAALQTVWGGVPFANGIAKDSDDKIYIASSVSGSVHVLKPFNSSTPLLKKVDEIVFGYSIDNVDVQRGEQGDVVVVGGHPSFTALTKLAADPHASRSSPSWLSIAKTRLPIPEGEKVVPRKGDGWHEPKHNGEWDVQTIYQDDGKQFSAATGASIDQARNILISPGLYETGLLVCRGVNNLL